MIGFRLKKWVSISVVALISAGFCSAQQKSQNQNLGFELKRGGPVKRMTERMDAYTRAYDVIDYQLDLTFPFVSSAFFGQVTLVVSSNQEGLDMIALHMVDLTADSVLSGGERIPFSQSDGEIRISLEQSLAKGDTCNLTVAYHGSPDRGFYFNSMCAFTFSEPEEARNWFPCHDVPWDKATAEIRVTVPAGVEVASIGLLADRRLSSDGVWETFSWRTSHQAATYLMCVTMSRFYSRWSDWVITDKGDSIEIAYYIFRRDSAKAVSDFVSMPDALTFFSTLFGPYPFEKYGMAEEEPLDLGMEHQTMTTITSQWIRGDRSYEHSFVHELAHMWWGDAVTLDDWPDIWLNEGFATYCEALYDEHVSGQSAYREKMNSMKGHYFYRVKQFNFPVYDPPVDSLFDYGIIYNKSGFVLHMLRRTVGDEVFWSILQTYYKTYEYQNASTSDFQTVCETVSGMDLGWFFRQWIYEGGYPAVVYSWESRPLSSGRYELVLAMDQTPKGGSLFRLPMDVSIETAAGFLDTTIVLDDFSKEYAFSLDVEPKGVILDPDGWVLMTSECVDRKELRSADIPDRFILYPNFPNPFNARTVIYYDVPEYGNGSDIRLAVYSLSGQQIRVLVEKNKPSGSYRTSWDGRDHSGERVSSGVYVLEYTSGQESQKKKMCFIK